MVICIDIAPNSRIKVKFPDRQSGILGLALLCKNGHAVDCCGNNIFGIYEEQLRLLMESDIVFEKLQ